jgi:O-antigen/teichoic acid export membrane protein
MLKLFFKFSYGTWVSAALSFFTTPIVTALIIPEEFGKAAMFTLAINFLMQIVQLGTDQSFVRFFFEKPENERNRLFWTCLYCPLLLTGIFTVFILIFWKSLSNLLFEKPDFKAIVLLSVCLFLAVAERFTTLVVRMKQRGNLFSTVKIVNSVVSVVVIILYAHYVARDFHAILSATMCALVISCIITIIAERKWFKLKINISKNDIKSILRYGLPFVPIFIIDWLFEGMDKVALRSWSSFEEIGLYSAAFKFVAPLTILQAGFCTFWAPVAIQKYEENNANTYFFEYAFKNILFLMLIAAIGLILCKDVVVLLFAPSYRSATQIMPFLVFIPFMYTLSEITGVGISFKKQTYWGIIVFSVAALVNLVGNYFLVPVYGAKGAAASTAIAYVVFFLLRTYFSVRLFPMKFRISKLFISLGILVGTSFINTFYKPPWYINLSILLFALIIYYNQLIEVYQWLTKNSKEGTF